MTRLLAFVAVLFLCFLPSASASPGLVDASPSAGSTITTAPEFVRLSFDRPIGGAGPYSVTVTGGQEIWSEPIVGADETVITVPLRHSMPPGEYLVSYEVTPPDGAAMKGQYQFSLGRPSTPGTPAWAWFLAGVTAVGALAAVFRLTRR